MPWFTKKRPVCEICKKEFSPTEVIYIKNIGPSLTRHLRSNVQDFDPKGVICSMDFRKMRMELLSELVDKSEENVDVVENIFIQEDYPVSISQDIQKMTFGERCSQKLTPFIGSWTFIICFISFVILWVTFNTQMEIKEHFDSYPFNFLNLFLSCMAAIQAPIIMMAQNQLSRRERTRADEDYYTNLKAELEIRQLHAKLDTFLKNHKPKE